MTDYNADYSAVPVERCPSCGYPINDCIAGEKFHDIMASLMTTLMVTGDLDDYSGFEEDDCGCLIGFEHTCEIDDDEIVSDAIDGDIEIDSLLDMMTPRVH